MTDREQDLGHAVQAMSGLFPQFHDPDLLRQLTTDPRGCGDMLLATLVDMVDHCLDRLEDGLESFRRGIPAMPACADAVAVLAQFGLIEIRSRRPLRQGARGRAAPYGCRILVSDAGLDPALAVNILAMRGWTSVCVAEWTERGKRFRTDAIAAWDAFEAAALAHVERKRRLGRYADRAARAGALLVLGGLFAWGALSTQTP